MGNFFIKEANLNIEIRHITDLEQPFFHGLERFGTISKALEPGIMTLLDNGSCQDCVKGFLPHASNIV